MSPDEYDALGRLIAVTDPLGRTSRTEYDAGNRVTATIMPSGARTTYTYDAADQLLSVTNPLGKVTATTYDAAGRPVTVTDADGRAVTTTYDAAGRPTKVTRADGSELSWTYDAAGRVLTSTDAAGAVTTYTYDAAGRRATATDVAGRVTSYTYGPSGLLDVVTLPGGGTISYAYDAVGRRTGIDYSDATPDVTYVYDDAGRTVQMLDGTGTTTYSYDDLNRLTGTTHAGASVGYAWDDLSRLTALTYPSGDVVSRTYDDAGQLATVTDWADREFAFDWTDDGQLAEVSYPNGVVTSYERDVAGQVTGLTAASQAGQDLLALAYGYSDAGLMTERTTTRGTEVDAAQFGWDPLARLDAVTGTGAGDVAFDAAGSVTVLPDGRQLTYDAGRQLTALTVPGAADTVVSTGFAYDARGNRLTATTDTGPVAGTVTHTYDLANRLTSITSVDDAVTTYTYDGNGLRATATTGEATESFNWDLAAACPLLLTDGEHAYIYGTAGVPLAQIGLDDGAVDYLHTDTLGSVLAATDVAGTVTAESDYDEYGLPQPAGDADPLASVSRFGFAGEYSDPTGYLYLRARYFDPATAQFLSVDPLVSATGDPYGYTGGNPLQFADPLGLWPDIDFDLGQTAKAIFAPVIASWNLVSGVAYSQTPWGRADQVNQFLQIYDENCGGIDGAWAAINVSFNPMYSAVASGAEAYDQFRAGNYGDALVAADEAVLITAATAAGAKGTVTAVRGALSRPVATKPAPTCFVAGTLIRTEHGLRPIEEIGAGDRVWARDLDTGRDSLQTVGRTFVRHTEQVIHLAVRGETMTTTPEHPFWVHGRGWVRAGDLVPGDPLATPRGLATVDGTRVERRNETVYNLRVEGLHNYYALAGDTAVLVHNANYADELLDTAVNIAEHSAQRAMDGDGTHYVRGVHPDAIPYYVDGVLEGQVPGVLTRYGLDNGRTAYWDPDKGALIIEDGSGGTVYTPTNGMAAFYELN